MRQSHLRPHLIATSIINNFQEPDPRPAGNFIVAFRISGRYFPSFCYHLKTSIKVNAGILMPCKFYAGSMSVRLLEASLLSHFFSNFLTLWNEIRNA